MHATFGLQSPYESMHPGHSDCVFGIVAGHHVCFNFPLAQLVPMDVQLATHHIAF